MSWRVQLERKKLVPAKWLSLASIAREVGLVTTMADVNEIDISNGVILEKVEKLCYSVDALSSAG